MSTPLVESIMTTTPPADLLRSVAARMRELAEAATPDRWLEMCLGSEGCQVIRDCGPAERGRSKVARFGGKRDWKHDHADAEYVAAVQPSVLLATAGMLEVAASYDSTPGDAWDVVQSAMAIARAFMDATGWQG